MFRTTQDINKITQETAFEFCERLKEAKWWWRENNFNKNMGLIGQSMQPKYGFKESCNNKKNNNE